MYFGKSRPGGVWYPCPVGLLTPCAKIFVLVIAKHCRNLATGRILAHVPAARAAAVTFGQTHSRSLTFCEYDPDEHAE